MQMMGWSTAGTSRKLRLSRQSFKRAYDRVPSGALISAAFMRSALLPTIPHFLLNVMLLH
jgi:hypothetical protein